MINSRFIFYKDRNTFESDRENINRSSIVFIEESLSIYTHGTEFKCFSNSISNQILNKLKFRLNNTKIEYSIDGTSWNTLIDLNSVDWTKVTNLKQVIQNTINLNVDLSKIESRFKLLETQVADHDSRILNLETSGSSNNYVLPTASSTTKGGIKTGFTQSGKNYPVQLDGQDRAYVNVPWTSSGNGSSTSGDTVSYNQICSTDYKIGELTINGIKNYIYGKLTEGGGNTPGGETGVTEDWVKEQIEDAINSLRDLIASNSTSSEKHTLSWWNENYNTGNIDDNVIYIITDDSGNTILGIGVHGILTRIPISASTVVKCTQSEYNAIDPKDVNTLYIITSDDGNTILKIYLGSVEIPFGAESSIDEIVIKSLITEMFSEKITWTEDGKIDKINYTMLSVDNPGEFYVTTGLDTIVDGVIDTKTSGFLAKSSEDATFASMFAAQATSDGYAKKSEITTYINDDTSGVKISADKIDIVGSDEFAAAVGNKVNDAITGAGFITKADADKAYASLSAFQELDDNVVKSATIITSINNSESNVTISADKIDLDGVVNAIEINTDTLKSEATDGSGITIEIKDGKITFDCPTGSWYVGLDENGKPNWLSVGTSPLFAALSGIYGTMYMVNDITFTYATTSLTSDTIFFTIPSSSTLYKFYTYQCGTDTANSYYDGKIFYSNSTYSSSPVLPDAIKANIVSTGDVFITNDDKSQRGVLDYKWKNAHNLLFARCLISVCGEFNGKLDIMQFYVYVGFTPSLNDNDAPSLKNVCIAGTDSNGEAALFKISEISAGKGLKDLLRAAGQELISNRTDREYDDSMTLDIIDKYIG